MSKAGKTEVQDLAQFVCAARYEDISAAAKARLKLHILDSIGCALGALGWPVPQKIREHIDSLGGTPQCSLIGSGRSAVDRAVQYNTALVRYLDFMDNFMASGETCHPSDNFAGVLAASELAGASGRDFLTALAVAYQVQIRLTEEAPIMRSGFDHATQQLYSVAAGAARAMKLTQQQTSNAIAIAGVDAISLAVIRAQPVSQWKGLASSMTALEAMQAVLLARRGITGPREIFEGPKGFHEALGKKVHVDWAREDLEAMMRCSLKRFNAEVHSQSALEGIIELRKANHLRGADVRKVKIDIFRTAYDIIGGGEFGPKDEAHTKEDADHNLKYLAAVALLDEAVEPAQFLPRRIAAKDVQDLMQQVKISKSRLYSMSYPKQMRCKITLKMRDGSTFSIEKKDYEGFYRRPMPPRQVLAKFDSLASAAADVQLRRQITEAVDNLESIPISELCDLLAQARLSSAGKGKASAGNAHKGEGRHSPSKDRQREPAGKRALRQIQ